MEEKETILFPHFHYLYVTSGLQTTVSFYVEIIINIATVSERLTIKDNWT